ncbi:MAG: hypothetical protein WB566_00520 [Terriglobales bacterium]
MLRHHDVPDDDKMIAAAHLLQHLEKQIAISPAARAERVAGNNWS